MSQDHARQGTTVILLCFSGLANVTGPCKAGYYCDIALFFRSGQCHRAMQGRLLLWYCFVFQVWPVSQGHARQGTTVILLCFSGLANVTGPCKAGYYCDIALFFRSGQRHRTMQAGYYCDIALFFRSGQRHRTMQAGYYCDIALFFRSGQRHRTMQAGYYCDIALFFRSGQRHRAMEGGLLLWYCFVFQVWPTSQGHGRQGTTVILLCFSGLANVTGPCKQDTTVILLCFSGLANVTGPCKAGYYCDIALFFRSGQCHRAMEGGLLLWYCFVFQVWPTSQGHARQGTTVAEEPQWKIPLTVSLETSVLREDTVVCLTFNTCFEMWWEWGCVSSSSS